MTRTAGASAAMACIAPMIAAAPPMSDFMVSMDFGGLSESPPESNVMPLPTNTTRLVRPARGAYSSRTSRGGCTEPWPTPTMPP